MRYRPLGRSGLMVSVVGLGTNNVGPRLDADGTRAVDDAAMEAGINLFDTADIYGGGASETLLGEVLKGRRDRVVLDASLVRLQTDHVDLYRYHTPDGITPLDETLATVDELVKGGKVLYVGSSNLDAWQVADADWIARRDSTAQCVSAQNEYSLLERGVEGELAPACVHFGIGILPYFPLASGLLTGEYRRDLPPPTGTRLQGRDDVFTDDKLDRLEELDRVAPTARRR